MTEQELREPPLLSDSPYLYFGSPHSTRDIESNYKHKAFEEGKQAQRLADIKWMKEHCIIKGDKND